MSDAPNVIVVFGDQWRAQAFGYAGNANVATPAFDEFSDECVNFTNAVSGCPVCSPYRASLMTGLYPVNHGVFLNDVCLDVSAPTLAETFATAGYDTAYIGKWHIDGHGRSAYIPPERRHGFDYWKVLECTHDYNNSPYYAGDSTEKRYWEGYDAFAQTDDAISYISSREEERKPFLLCLSWGPPHAPYETAPEEFRRRYSPDRVVLRDNVPSESAEKAAVDLAGYYAHCSALDSAFSKFLSFLKEKFLYDDTILLFTSDHGDMLGSQGEVKKQRPWDESIRVPFLLKPAHLEAPKTLSAPIDAPDLMPTLLGLAGIEIPDTVDGRNFSDYINGESDDPSEDCALISCPHPFGQWSKPHYGGREYRGIRTSRHTYVRDLDGPWLLYDNLVDPFQLRNLVDDPAFEALAKELDSKLSAKLAEVGDEFLPSDHYIREWGYKVDDTGTVGYEL